MPSTLRHGLADADVRRAQASYALAWTGEWTFTVALSVFAFREGGATAVGLVGLLRMLPSAVATPFVAPVADRVRRERVLVAALLVRAAAILLAALVGSAAAVYALAVVATIAGTLYRPVHSALLPSLCRTARRLFELNAVRGLVDSLATLLGPAVAAVALAAGSVEGAFAAAALATLLSASVILRLDYEEPPRETPSGPMRPLGDVADGLRAVLASRDAALLFGLTAAQTFLRGASTVLLVVLAIDLLDEGEAHVGTLTAAIGVGAVLGSLLVAARKGQRGLSAWFGVGVALWGAPLVLVGVFPSEVLALVLLACVGVGNALVDIGLFTLPARLVEEHVLARAFTVLEALIALSVALGSVVAALVVSGLGERGAFVAFGLLTPLLVGLAWGRLRRLDDVLAARDTDVSLLRGVPMLATLPMPTIEHLARRVQRVAYAAGEIVFERGERGDRFYVVVSGVAEVLDGEVVVEALGRGASFGEIALLRELTRTMTVRARSDLELCTLGRREFSAAVEGYTLARTESDTLIMHRLEGDAIQPPG